MKNHLLFASLLLLWISASLQAQIICDFDSTINGNQGFSNLAWGAATTSVERIGDPTARSSGVLAVEYNGTLGSDGYIAKYSINPGNSRVLSIMVYLPTDFPDDGFIQIIGQDNQNWTESRPQRYLGSDMPKQRWFTLNFYTMGNHLYDPNSFNPYYPNSIGRLYFQIAAGIFKGRILFDDVTLLGNQPTFISNFEKEAFGINGWADNGWGTGISLLQRESDPTGESSGVLAIGLTLDTNTRATIEKDNISITKNDHVISFKLWIPADFPDSTVIQIAGQDNIKWGWNPQLYHGSDLRKGNWNELYYPILQLYTSDSSSFIPYTAGTFAKFIIGFSGHVPFSGIVYFDDLNKLQPTSEISIEPQSPPIEVMGGVDTLINVSTGQPIFFNAIHWVDLPMDMGESYKLYYSEKSKITDITAPDVIQISPHIPRGVMVFNHRLSTINGEEKTVWYAMTVNNQAVRDGISNSEAITAKTTKLYEIPLMNDFPFVPDALLDEFKYVSAHFTRCRFNSEDFSNFESGHWTSESSDLNSTFYIIMDSLNLYVGAEIIDDNPHGNGFAWEGDGFEIFGGLYDTQSRKSVWNGDDTQRGGNGGGFRLGVAINQTDHIEVGGYESWNPEGSSYIQKITPTGYSVEMKIPFAALKDKFLLSTPFVPASGMTMPFRIDVNDNDGTIAHGTSSRSLQTHVGGIPTNFQFWQRAEALGAPVMITETPLENSLNKWIARLNINADGKTINRYLGGDPTGSDNVDTNLDELSPPINNNYNAVFTIHSTLDYLVTDIRRWTNLQESTIRWTLEVVNADSFTTIISWNPVRFPESGIMMMTADGLNVNMHKENQVTFTGNKSLNIEYRSTITADYTFTHQGWYLISLPVIPQNNLVSTLFPSVLEGKAFKWDPNLNEYLAVENLENGIGYWIAIPESTTCRISGEPLNRYTLSFLTQGWYLIGSVLGGEEFSTPNDNPDGSVLSPAFEWDAGMVTYEETSNLYDTGGYWIAVLNPCSLTIGGREGGVSKTTDATELQLFYNQHGNAPPGPPNVNWNKNHDIESPDAFGLMQNYPNPFNPETRIGYRIPHAGLVKIEVYDLLGRFVRNLVNKTLEAGSHETMWDGKDEQGLELGSGMYLIRMQSDRFEATQKLLLMR